MLFKRLTFTPVNETNSPMEDYTDLLGNIDNMKMVNDGRIYTPIEVEKFIQSQINCIGDYKTFSVFNDINFIGSLNVRLIPNEYIWLGDDFEDSIEIGMIIDNKYWNRGYGKEIVLFAYNYVRSIENKGSKYLIATADPSNIFSIRILENIFTHKHPDIIQKFNGKSRLLFYEPI